jgi:hypothetical protein
VRLRVGAGGMLGASENVSVVIPAETAAMGDAMLSRRGLAASSPYTRSADPRFRRNERLRLEVPVSSPGAASARLLDRRGTAMQVPVAVTERPDDSGAFTWLLVDVTLTPLGPGDYAIEVTRGSTLKAVAFRVVPQ